MGDIMPRESERGIPVVRGEHRRGGRPEPDFGSSPQVIGGIDVVPQGGRSVQPRRSATVPRR
jgi:hypothetical protein